jgi:hypothetical protein
MKNLMILGLAMASIASLASCSSDETVDTPAGKAIQFSGAFVDKSTRSTEDPSFTTETLEDFNVYGWVAKDETSAQIFDNVKVSKSGSDWTYENLQYWIAGGQYTFSAIKGENGTISLNDNGARVATPSITGFTSDGETDLIYGEAEATGAASGNAKVAFTFQHQLAKVKFSFLNSTPSTASIDAKVTSIKITDATKTGKVELSNTIHGAAWSDQDGAYELGFGDADQGDDFIGKTTATASTNEKLMIPVSGTTYNVEFTTEIFQNGVSIKTVTHKATITPTFQAGYAYNFTATLTEENIDPESALEPIEFTLTEVKAWENGAEGTATITEQTKSETETPAQQD